MVDDEAADPGGPDLPELSAAAVLTSDGVRAGRVEDIYLADASGAFAAIGIALGRFGSRSVVVPAAALASEHPDEEGRVRLVVDARTLRGALPAPATLHLTPEDLVRAHREIGLEELGVA